MKTEDFLREVVALPGVTGNEGAVAQYIAKAFEPYCDDVKIDCMNSVIGHIAGNGPKVILCAHLDEIGLMVSAIGSDGTLMVTKIGGIYPTTYPGPKVRIYTKNGIIYGAVANSRSIAKNKDLDASALRIDIGAENKEDAKKYVELGDTVTFDFEGFVDDVVLHSVVAGSEEILAELLAEKLNRL